MFFQKQSSVQQIPPSYDRSMQGAGLFFGVKRYITHTTLKPEMTAFFNLTWRQKLVIATLAFWVVFGIFSNTLGTFQGVIAILSFVYFLDAVFNLYLIVKSLSSPADIKSDEEEISRLSWAELPIYTILCPLYKEARVIPRFLKAIEKLDWPKDKLDVILLLEADDSATISEVLKQNLPSYIRPVVVPDSTPKTKPKACNFGLSLARGEYLVIYDAEDEPEPSQLKKAYSVFQKVPRDVVCLQAKLNYYNPNQNILTRLFTAEYSLWFDITLTGLQKLDTAMPLGGTSNHFRKVDLDKLEGWDAFNVTEDADLGIRLFKAGYKTAIFDSTTYEEANSNLGNWIRQRSRWIKGYIQTYFVHMRNPIAFFKNYGSHAWFFQLLIGGKIAFCVINPVLWLMTISYFALHGFAGPTIEALYPGGIFYLALTSFVFGNFMFFYCYMIGCARRGQWGLLKYLVLLPIYWFLISIATFVALYQFIFKPHFWEKTDHGLDFGAGNLHEGLPETSSVWRPI